MSSKCYIDHSKSGSTLKKDYLLATAPTYPLTEPRPLVVASADLIRDQALVLSGWC